MKKVNQRLEQQVPEGIQDLMSRQNYLSDQDIFLFITHLPFFTLTATDFRGLDLFKENLEKSRDTETCFYKEITHPDDYDGLKRYMRSCHSLQSEQQREFLVRLRTAEGNWKKYLFRNRFYAGFPEREGDFLLSLVSPFDSVRRMNGGNFQSEQELTESRNRYRALVDSLDEGFSVVDVIFDLDQKPIDYLFTELNPAFEKHVGLMNPLGSTMREFSPDHQSHWFETYGRVAITGKPIRFERFAKDLNESWLETYAFPIGSKKYRKVASLCSDITARKLSEENLKKQNGLLEKKVRKRTKALKNNNELLQLVFDAVNQGIFVLKPVFGQNGDINDFSYVRVNETLARYYRNKDMIDQGFLELNPDAAKKGIFEIFKQTMLTGKVQDLELLIERNGKKSWFRITSRRQKGLLINTMENITRRKRKAESLKENMRFRKQLVQTSPDIIIIFSLTEQKVKFMNRDLSAQPGMNKENIVGMPLLNIIPYIHPEDREKALEFHSGLSKASDREIIDIEFRLKIKRNHWECHHARGKVFRRDVEGNPYEYLIFLRNVQEQKLTQKALFKAEKLSIKGEMARTLAHELRNPLASIGLSADILEKRIKESPDEVANYLEIIKRSTKSLNSLVTDLLTSSKYSPSILVKCCLAHATDLALKEAEDRIYLTGILVVKKYKQPRYIYADKEKLKIALLNIIVNASEAMTANEGVLTLDIKEAGNTYVLHISDNGCGLEKEQMEQLFDSFYTKKPDGVGIGLNSVKNILQEHEAGIKVKSTPAKGTTFSLSFQRFQDASGSAEEND